MFIFIHIPKTSGTSFLTQMNNIFSDNSVFRLTNSDYESLINVVKTRLTPNQHTCNFVAGHFPFSLLNEISQDLFLYTLLRDPIERVESLYRFYKEQPYNCIAHLGLAPNFTFDDFINSNEPSLYAQVNNGMSRQLARSPDFFDPCSKFFMCESLFDMAYESALDFISTQNFGLVERLNDSNIILAKILNLNYTIDNCKENVTNPTSQYLDYKHKDVIISKNKYDISLYQKAIAIFDSRFQNSSNSPVVNKISNLTIFRPIFNKKYSIADIPGRQGFYNFESSGIAWLREDALARVNIQFSQLVPYKLILSFYSVKVFDPTDAVDLFINEEKVQFDIVYDQNNKNIFDLIVLVGEVSCKKSLELIIKPFFYYDPQSLGIQTMDKRKLSLALISVQLTST
jgi:hypothetical protein